MVHNRQDAWTEDEDRQLAETVLQFIRDGRTQLEAFEEVARQLSRTSAACGFRWNATVRKQYDQEILLAKKERRKKASPKASEESSASQEQPFEFDEAIDLLKKIKQTYETSTSSSDIVDERMQEIARENEILRKKIEKYEEALRQIMTIWETVSTESDKRQG
ncbi:RsfA family transcriptional regulator [Virgibacillus sp. MSP4-1]|uniref:RsfA family transcriptional regulator n=1 Tax=Virgibacillus sp. MSP4-1 TaxID=2700081 RepID=UPI00039BD421|nr:RsfA family transcriptional regulator [Virgibacillus sp. MSP4-1]QHS22153.1 RsfA family transcriptional regulator [Virgibacillus sp. MSP4-1]